MFDRILFGLNDGVVSFGHRRTASNSTSETSVPDEVQGPASPKQPAHATDTESSPVETPTSSEPKTQVQGAVRQRSKGAVGYWQRLWRRPQNTWHPSALQMRSVAGLSALCVVVGCMFASLAVLLLSDNSPVDHWPIQPTVYLAIITAFANSAFALAWMEAQPISWWYSAYRGRSIASLERQWQISRSAIQSLRYSRCMSLLNLACLAAAFVVIDGPLLQRASTVSKATSPVNVALELDLPPELPTGFSGRINEDGVIPTGSYAGMAKEYLNQASISLNVSGCPGKCRATVLGPGVTPINCSSKVDIIPKETMRSPNATWGPWKVKNDYGKWSMSQFDLTIIAPGALPSYGLTGRELAELTIGRLQYLEAGSKYNATTCYLASAVLRYEIHIDENIISLPRQQHQGELISLADNTNSAFHNESTRISTIDGLSLDMNMIFSAHTYVMHSFHDHGLWLQDGDYVSAEAYKYQNFQGGVPSSSSYYFSDPTDDIIFEFNNYMLRAGVLAASWSNISTFIDPGLSVHQKVTGQTLPLVYQSDLKWFAGAAIVEAATLLLILPMFWGWWTLGSRDTSLSPFTIALAFDSPLLKDINSASGARGVVQELGDMKVKYGVVVPPEVEKAELSSEVPHNGCAMGRLGIAEKESVGRPRKGERFSK